MCKRCSGEPLTTLSEAQAMRISEPMKQTLWIATACWYLLAYHASVNGHLPWVLWFGTWGLVTGMWALGVNSKTGLWYKARQ